jgi:hypothetical protein
MQVFKDFIRTIDTISADTTMEEAGYNDSAAYF